MSCFSVRFTPIRNGLCTWYEWEREGKGACKNLVGKSKGNRPLKSDGSIILEWILTLNLLTTTIVAPPSNANKWQMGFNSAFKGVKKQDGGEWTGSTCFQDRKGSGLL